jgi:hypothetical protein
MEFRGGESHVLVRAIRDTIKSRPDCSTSAEHYQKLRDLAPGIAEPHTHHDVQGRHSEQSMVKSHILGR